MVQWSCCVRSSGSHMIGGFSIGIGSSNIVKPLALFGDNTDVVPKRKTGR